MGRNRMVRGRGPLLFAAGLLLSLIAASMVSGPASGAGRPGGGEDGAAEAEWREETRGDFGAPAHKAARAAPGFIEAEFVLPPGRRVTWEKAGRWEIREGDRIDIAFSCDRANLSSSDYRKGKARFPVSVDIAFGRDSVEPAARARSRNPFRGIRRAFGTRGIRLVYACGNDAPAGSMYRLGDDVTVFILAGGEEGGGSVVSTRDLVEDFRAAYGRPPRGPLTKASAGADRPASEEGAVKGSVSLRLPGGRSGR